MRRCGSCNDASMDSVRLVGPMRAVEIFGVRLVGVNVDNGTKLAITLVFLIALWLLATASKNVLQHFLRRPGHERARATRAS